MLRCDHHLAFISAPYATHHLFFSFPPLMDMYLPDSIPAEAYTPAEACTQHQKEKGPSTLVSIDIKPLETHSNGFKLSHTFISEPVAMAREME